MEMTQGEAFTLAKRSAAACNKDWLVFRNRDESYAAEPFSGESVKRALLARGTKGKFYLVSGTHDIGLIQTWRSGIRLYRNAQFLMALE